jgi:glycerophosphoryl diester phosphodiesterase
MTVEDAKEFALRFGWPLDGKKFPLAIGHRGASGHATENTLTAFAKASDLGAEMWELDTQLTKDGICVVSHDDHLQRVFGLDRRISELTAAELATLEGASVPTFAAVAALARERDAGLYVELKADGTGPIVWHELLRHGQRFAALGSFDVGQVHKMRDAGCGYPLSVLVRVGADPHTLAERRRDRPVRRSMTMESALFPSATHKAWLSGCCAKAISFGVREGYNSERAKRRL